jgi:Flp pilus assembly protein TadG
VRDLIRALARPALRSLHRDERGVVAVIVGLLLGTVLLGLGALVIDVGQIYQERAELQNGADAAALAVAKSCAISVCTASGALTTAGTYANANASVLTGNKEAVTSACGFGTGDSLTACGTPGTALTACPTPNPPAGTNYVDVNTSTKTSSGATVIAPIFAKELLGNGSYTGTTVKACAQVKWGGAPSNTLSTAFTIPACQWDAATTQGTVYGAPPPYPPNAIPPASYDKVLHLGTGNGTGCATEVAGSDGPGTFGWVSETGGCTEGIIGTTYGLKSGSSSLNCNTPLFDDAQNRSVIYVPVYTSVTSFGTTSTPPTCTNCAVYNLKGIAAFVVTGYNVPGSTFTSYTDWLNAANQCTGTTYCINGYFVRAEFAGSGTFGPNNLGLYMIHLTG